jgi:hypothetical protein
VIPALQTSDEVVERAKAFGMACKKGELFEAGDKLKPRGRRVEGLAWLYRKCHPHADDQ